MAQHGAHTKVALLAGAAALAGFGFGYATSAYQVPVGGNRVHLYSTFSFVAPPMRATSIFLACAAAIEFS